MIPSPVKSGVTGFVILLSRTMEYIKIENEIDCIEADTLFNELIKYESNLDNFINGNANI